MRRFRKGVTLVGIAFLFTMGPMMAESLSPQAQNIGGTVNSEYSDFAPVVSADGQYLYFTSDRPGGLGGQDIWESHLIDGQWTKPSDLGAPINTSGNEGPDCIVTENDRKYLYLTKCHGAKEGLCDIYVSEQLGDGSWSEPKDVGAPLNSDYSDANASYDYVNKVMYFVSTRPGGIAGPGPKRLPDEASYDIWMCPREQGGWGKPVNLGQPVNTPGWEGVAFFHSAEQTLYFSSDGHGGMGGADVFKSVEIAPGVFGDPEPVSAVNTTQNDMYFSIPAAGDFAYYSSNASGGVGMEDIYVIPVVALLPPQVIAVRPMQIAPKRVTPQTAAAAIGASHVETIYFDFDRSILLLSEKEKLDKLADFLTANPQVGIDIAGHTDSVGSDDYNVLLSKARADSVYNYLKLKGISTDRMMAMYYGENKPAEKNDPKYGNPLNRRVEISIR